MSEASFQSAGKHLQRDKRSGVPGGAAAISLSNSDRLSAFGPLQAAPGGMRTQAAVPAAPREADKTHFSAGGLTPMTVDNGLTAGPIQAKESKKEKKDNAYERDSMMKYYNSKDLAGKVEMMRQLAYLNTVSDTAATKAEFDVYANLTKQFTPEMATEAMRGSRRGTPLSSSLSKTGCGRNAGQAKTNFRGKTKTQAEADNDYASMLARQSDVAAKQQAYSELIYGANMAVRKNGKLQNAVDDFKRIPNPDNIEANNILTTDYNVVKYTMGDAGDSYVENTKIAEEKNAADWQRPWRQKRPWWHFW